MIKGSDIAKRYAKAFFDIARGENKTEDIFEEISKFSAVVDQSKDLIEFLANPVFDESDKKTVVGEILRKIKVSAITTNFLNLLVDKGRIAILPDIADCYRQYMDEIMNRVRVDVKTAYALSDDMSEKLKQKISDLVGGKNVEMAVERDSSLLGGVVVKVGDTIYDGSLKAQLSSIRGLLREEI